MKVFYRHEQVAKNASSYSPSAGKPAMFVSNLFAHELIQPDDVMDFEPASVEDLCLAHDPDFVRGVLAGNISNGFGNTSMDVARSLPFTTGSMIAAAEHAVMHKEHTCSPTSGFHHAHYGEAAGFCTFNGLIVTAMKLKQAGLVNTVGIVDCDYHYGDGTDDIIRRLGLKWIKHITMGQHMLDRKECGVHGAKYTDLLGTLLKLEMKGVDLVLYQAGADPHINDPLGGILSTERMMARDKLVFEHFKGTPLAWNLAGGYQRDRHGSIGPVLELHRNTVRAYNEVHHATHLESQPDPSHS